MEEALDSLIPDDPGRPYDMKEIIRLIVDDGQFFEIHESYAQNIVVGFARLGGHSIGIVANQPTVLAGVLDINSSEKAARFVPLRRLQYLSRWTPGFMPGIGQARQHHPLRVQLLATASYRPKLTVVTRKAYGGAYDVMSSKHIRGDVNLAWPSAEIAVMGPEGAVNIIFRKELAQAEDPARRKAELVAEYRQKFANPYVAASRGCIDDVIEPRETPASDQCPGDALNNAIPTPPRKHGCISYNLNSPPRPPHKWGRRKCSNGDMQALRACISPFLQ
jgi:propionyl-CoA carboxylase beta chain